MTEILPAGLLPQIGRSFSVTDSMTGEMVSVYALGSTLFAVPLVLWTKTWSRKSVLMLALGVLLVFNTLTACSTSFTASLGYRFAAGMAAGLIWGVMAGYARRLVARKDQGKALAIAAVGQPVALALGMPLTTTLSGVFDWHWIFGIMSILSGLLILCVLFGVPNIQGTKDGNKKHIFQTLAIPGVVAVLAVMFFWILAHNMLYIYTSSYLSYAGIPEQLNFVLLIFGVSAIVSIFFIGMQIDRHLRIIVIVGLAGFAMASLLLVFFSHSTAIIYASVVLWGLIFGGASTLLQTALADAAGRDADSAQSFFVTLFNLAIAGGGYVGGLVLDWSSAGFLPVVALCLIVVALVIALTNNTYAFPRGHRVRQNGEVPATAPKDNDVNRT